MIRKLGEFILRGYWSAAMVALLAGILPLLNWLAIVIVGLVTLRKGTSEGFLVLLWASVPELIGSALGFPTLLITTAVAGNLLVWIAAGTLRYTNSWEKVLEICVGVGVLIVLFAHAYMNDITQWWMLQYKHLLQLAMHPTLTNTLSNTQLQAWQPFIASLDEHTSLLFLAKISTGALVAVKILGSLFNLVLARWWQANLFNPGGLRKELYHIRMPVWFTLILLICALLAWIDVYWILDSLPLLLMPYFLAAFSLIHRLSAHSHKKWLWLGMFYTAFFLSLLLSSSTMLFILCLALIIIALGDSIFNFRERLSLLT